MVGIVVVAGIAYLPFGITTATSLPALSQTTQTSAVSTSSETSNSNSSLSYSTVSSSGLKLVINLNATETKYGGSLSAEVELFNTLPKSLSLGVNYSVDHNIVTWNEKDFLCNGSSVADLFGFSLYQGHYAASNISQAKNQLQLSPPVATYCFNPNYYEPYISEVTFSPESSSVNITSNGASGSTFKELTLAMALNATTENCESSPYNANGTSYQNGTTTTFSGTELSFGCGNGTAINGYWTAPANGTYVYPNMQSNSTILDFMNALYQNYFHQLPASSYTVVAQDLWNQTVYAYFQVNPSSESTATSSTN